MAKTSEFKAKVAQAERIGLGDLAIAGTIAVVTWALLAIWEFPGLYPRLWADVVVATGVRPAINVVPGYWTGLASIVYGIFGIGGGEIMLRALGHFFLAGIGACVYAVLREWLTFTMRARPQSSRRRTLVTRLAAALGAALFVFADPVWISGQCLSEPIILLALGIGAFEFFFVFLRKGEIKYAYFCSMLLGLLTAESPIGLFLLVLFVSLNIFVVKVMPALESPLYNPTVMEVGKWYITFIFLASLILGIVINCGVYILHDGIAAVGASSSSIPLAYLLDYWARISNAASGASWVLWFGVCVLPSIIATIKLPSAADEEQFLPYFSGIIFFVCGIAAFSQSTFISSLWFWTYFPVNSQFLLSMGILCCAATAASAITVLGVDSLCRDHNRLAEQLFGGEQPDEEEAEDNERYGIKQRAYADVAKMTGSMNLIRRVAIILIPTLIVLIMLPGRVKSTMREMLSIIDDAIDEIVTEAESAEYLFTDGNLDTAIEIESAKRGGVLNCYSLMGGDSAMIVHLRTRKLKDSEDKFSFRYDTAMGLRSWIRDKPERLAESAALMGFDLWKRDGKPLPPMGGLVSRPLGFVGADTQRRGIEVAHDLAKRTLAVHARPGGIKTCSDDAVIRTFLTLQWRIARMCFYRSEVYDFAGRAEEAIAEVEISKELNERNDIYKKLTAAMEKRNSAMLQKLTPREGLQLALVRADFMMGKIYAETVLGADPDDPDANFALGMYFLKEHQLSRAESYLRHCLLRRPDEPAVYNNLAMIQIELKKFKAAKINIDKALELAPDSAAILDTRRLLEETQKKANAVETK